MTTVAVGPRFIARVSRIETFRCGPVGVSGATFCRERLPEPRKRWASENSFFNMSNGVKIVDFGSEPRRDAKQLPVKWKRVS